MHNRTGTNSLSEKLNQICSHVYFQPPKNVTIEYPAIIYKVEDVDAKYADNIPYLFKKKYRVIAVEKNPDSPIADNLSRLPTANFLSAYVSNNLYHTVYSIYC